ncbi:MAG: GDP-mannose 4,6-dehydratase [Candidatus Omnitrophota bacterium]|jgi:GDPmannose 4,6-dehydratase
MKRAIIVGCQGQDGRLLYDYLIKKQYQVIGIDINYLKASFGYQKEPIDVTNRNDVSKIIRSLKPNQVYYLAAVHHSAEDKIQQNNVDLFQKSFEINTFSLIYFLEAILKYSLKTRLFYAASSHIFGEANSVIDNEESNIDPSSVYGITKAAGLFACRYYRKEYSIFASCGILYNHESSFRSDNFISKKIIKAAINIKNKKQEKLVLGDLNAEVDWGFAPDYIAAMYKILKLKYSDDFIIATGKKHKVSEFVESAFKYLGLEWKHYVEENGNILTKKPICRVGDYRKLMSISGWKPATDFKHMIKILLDEQGAFEKKIATN